MTIGPAEIRHVAALAEVAVDPADEAVLAAQLESIVAFVARLDELVDAPPEFTVADPVSTTPLREDVVNPIPMNRTPGDMAPAFAQGFYIVPRRTGLVDE